MNPTQAVATLSAKSNRIPKELELVHAYHPSYKKLIDFATKLTITGHKTNKTTKAILFIKQKGRCYMCGETLLNADGEFKYDGSTNIHHMDPRSEGGRKSGLNNLALSHTSCHKYHHQHGRTTRPNNKPRRQVHNLVTS